MDAINENKPCHDKGHKPGTGVEWNPVCGGATGKVIVHAARTEPHCSRGSLCILPQQRRNKLNLSASLRVAASAELDQKNLEAWARPLKATRNDIKATGIRSKIEEEKRSTREFVYEGNRYVVVSSPSRSRAPRSKEPCLKVDTHERYRWLSIWNTAGHTKRIRTTFAFRRLKKSKLNVSVDRNILEGSLNVGGNLDHCIFFHRCSLLIQMTRSRFKNDLLSYVYMYVRKWVVKEG